MAVGAAERAMWRQGRWSGRRWGVVMGVLVELGGVSGVHVIRVRDFERALRCAFFQKRGSRHDVTSTCTRGDPGIDNRGHSTRPARAPGGRAVR